MSIIKLRPYQNILVDKINTAWGQTHKNVMARLPTGGGKTVIFSHILQQHQGAKVAIAHRQELVGQIALSLARNNVRHRIIGPNNLVRMIVQDQMRELGTSLFDPNAQCAVAGVDTLINRKDALLHWSKQVTLWVQDEAHHVLADNKWGAAAEMFPNAKGLGVTATPIRADGRGLGRHADGLMDVLVEGPDMRWLIDNGYLTDYRVFCPPNDIDLSQVTVSSATGDYTAPKLKKAVRESHVVGDIVQHYLRIAPGKLCVVFATDVETATDIAREFVGKGVKAEVVSAKTEDRQRTDIIRKFRNRELTVLVNVDLFGEGFDLPAIEVVSFARPTESYGLYCQQFGRALRPMEGKQVAIIIDHVGNVVRHGLPDRPRVWSLDAREKSSRSVPNDDEIPLRPCANCTRPYLRTERACPYCGHVPVPTQRTPEFVDGDLHEIDPQLLMAMRAEIARVDGDGQDVAQTMLAAGAPRIAVNGMLANHRTRQEAQKALRESISWWAGYQAKMGRSDSESYRRFYLTFGIDILSAQALGKPDAVALADKINTYIGSLT